MSYACELSERAMQPVLCIRTRTPVTELPRVIGGVYAQIGAYLGELGEVPAGPPFTAYHNMDMNDLDVEAGFPVSRPLPGRGEIKSGEIPPGTAATCLHKGPYDKIGSAYTALSAWLKEKGRESSGPAYEFYLNDPSTTPPEQLMTLVLFPLRPA